MKPNNTLLNLVKIVFFSIILIAASSSKAELKVVTTIKPVHSLLANVMKGVGEPALIIDGSTSPHNFTLKPSHAKLIEQADIIFWIGKDLETFMFLAFLFGACFGLFEICINLQASKIETREKK